MSIDFADIIILNKFKLFGGWKLVDNKTIEAVGTSEKSPNKKFKLKE